MHVKKTYNKPFAKVLEFHTRYDCMVQGDPRGSYVVNDFEEDDPITIGGDDDANAAPYGKSLWDDSF